MNILTRIVKDKRKEVELRSRLIPINQLEQSILFNRSTFSLVQNLSQSATGIIAEHKRRSPSKAVINHNLNVQDVAIGYEKAGVCGMSVLSDSKYFGGSLDDLLLARASCELPLLRKEFIISEYQIIESKAFGADAILLIAAILKKDEIKRFSELAKSLHLEIILEVHNTTELTNSLMPSLQMIGVNNRNLKTFEVDLDNSVRLRNAFKQKNIFIAESGIKSREDINYLKLNNINVFLIGESLMRGSF